MHFRTLKRLSAEVSLSEPIDTDKEGNTLALMDIISADNTILDRVDTMDLEKSLHRLILEKLEDREQKIIAMRYGLYHYQPQTQREIAKKCNISRSYVSRIEKKALQKLEESLSKEKPRD